MFYGDEAVRPGQKRLGLADDAVVPSMMGTLPTTMTMHYSGLAPNVQAPPPGPQFFDKQAPAGQPLHGYDLQPSSAYSGSLQPGLVPQPSQPVRLTSAQQSELEMARRRAQKAAEGKRANALARRQKRKAQAADERKQEEEQEQEQDEGSPAEDGDNDSKDPEAKGAAVPDEKEAKRLKRLLRNRVSAQQARERKKEHLTKLEVEKDGLQAEIKRLQNEVQQLEQRAQKAEREAVMLRNVMKNMQASGQ